MKTPLKTSPAQLLAALSFLCAPFATGQAHAITTYASTNLNLLLRFDSATPNVIVASANITGVGNGEAVVGLDFRLTNRKLYAVTRDGSSVGRLYTLNTATAVATLVATISLPLTSLSFGAYGIDFDPIGDTLRLVNDDRQNLRINPATGAALADTSLTFATDDPNASGIPRVIAAAYGDDGTLYDYAFNIDSLVRQTPPNSGTLRTIGASGIPAYGPVKLDIERGGGRAFASAPTFVSGYSLYSVNLGTGALALVGLIGDGTRTIRGLALVPARNLVVNSSADTGDGVCDALGTGDGCTLREAITAANADTTSGRDTISFAIPGLGVRTIVLNSDLPTLTDSVLIDGTTQPGSAANSAALGDNAVMQIEINAAAAQNGLKFAASDSVVRGLVINRAQNAGILIDSGTNVSIEGNFLGTNAPGTAALPNGGAGIAINSAGNRVGFETNAARNLIAGNAGNGIALNSGANATIIRNNLIGTDASGSVALGNALAGVLVASADNRIGGPSGLGNTIGFNGGDGVTVSATTSTGNALIGNGIFANGGLGLNLQPSGETANTVTPNDAGDNDSGPNGLQNFPVLQRVILNNGVRTLEGTFNSAPNNSFTLEFFSSPTADASGYGEGQTLLGTLDVTTNTNGDANFSYDLSALTPDRVVAATATSALAHETSEFSNALSVRLPGTVQLSTTAQRVDENAGSATVTVTRAGGSDGTVAVSYATADGSATAPADYTATSGTLVFAAGETTKTLTIPLQNDAIAEGDETFTVTLVTPTGGATLGATVAQTVTIADDDIATLTLALAPNSFREDAGATAATGTIARNTPNAAPLTVNLLTSNTARVAVPASVTIPAGQNMANFPISANDNTLLDGTQTVVLTASAPGLSAATATVTVFDNDVAVNAAPTANGQTLSTPEDTALALTLSASDAETPAASLTYRVVTAPAHGTLSGSAPNLVYTPNLDFNGADAFVFVANDGARDSQAATVALQVLAVNDAPVSSAQQVTADNATPLAITLGATDVDGDALGFEIIGAPQHGTLSGSAPNLIYAAAPGFQGSDAFTFTASDGRATSLPATIALTIGGDAPVKAVDDAYTLVLGAPKGPQQSGVTLATTNVFTIAAPGLLANDSFPAGSALTVRAINNPAHGRFQLRTDGTLFYLPNSGYVGQDAFDYVLSDGKTSSIGRVRFNLIDERTPELAFDTPRDRATVSAINEIKGRVRDRNAGIKNLTLLWRRFDGAYWNGSQWTKNATELPLQTQGINWIYSGARPVPGTNPGKSLLEGRYDLRVTATDNSGNFNRVTNRLTVDNRAPHLQLTAPIATSASSADLNAATPVLGLDAIAGRARDDAGVARVDLILRRAKDGAYWNGTAFTSAPARFPAQVARNGDWKADRETPVKIPALADLKLGTYLITVYAYDRLGNEARVEAAVQIVQTGAAGA